MTRKRESSGVVAASRKKGYLYISVNGLTYVAHRLAWLYMTGKWPTVLIDHKNGDKMDNRFANLREATYLQNFWNRGKRSDNTSGYKGVSYNRKLKKYGARVTVKKNGVTEHNHIGVFDTAEEAYEAYKKAALEAFGEFARIE